MACNLTTKTLGPTFCLPVTSLSYKAWCLLTRLSSRSSFMMSGFVEYLGRRWTVPIIDPCALATMSPAVFASHFFATSQRNRKLQLSRDCLMVLLTDCLRTILAHHCMKGKGFAGIDGDVVLKNWKNHPSWDEAFQEQPKRLRFNAKGTTRDKGR